MSLDSLIAAGQLPAIPNDEVDFDVAASLGGCSVPVQAAYAALGGRLSVRISTLIARAALHFTGGVAPLKGLSKSGTQIALAWQNLCHLRPRQVCRAATKKRPAKRCLVVDAFQNSRFQAVLTEYLAAAVGLTAAIRIFGIPYRKWAPPAALPPYDFSAPQTAAGPILLETRGRFNRDCWAGAKAQLVTKRARAQAAGGFAAFCGTIFAPRDTTRGRAEDLWIDDPEIPEGEASPETAMQLVQRHYGLLMQAVGAVELGEHLLEAAKTPESSARVATDERRVGLRLLEGAPTVGVGGDVLLGMTLTSMPWYAGETDLGELRVGVVREQVARVVLGEADPKDRGFPEVSLVSDGTRLLTLDDGAVLAWAPSTSRMM